MRRIVPSGYGRREATRTYGPGTPGGHTIPAYTPQYVSLGPPRPAGHQHGLAARCRQRDGDGPCGSRRRIPVGRSLSVTSGS